MLDENSRRRAPGPRPAGFDSDSAEFSIANIPIPELEIGKEVAAEHVDERNRVVNDKTMEGFPKLERHRHLAYMASADGVDDAVLKFTQIKILDWSNLPQSKRPSKFLIGRCAPPPLPRIRQPIQKLFLRFEVFRLLVYISIIFDILSPTEYIE